MLAQEQNLAVWGVECSRASVSHPAQLYAHFLIFLDSDHITCSAVLQHGHIGQIADFYHVAFHHIPSYYVVLLLYIQ